MLLKGFQLRCFNQKLEDRSDTKFKSERKLLPNVINIWDVWICTKAEWPNNGCSLHQVGRASECKRHQHHAPIITASRVDLLMMLY